MTDSQTTGPLLKVRDLFVSYNNKDVVNGVSFDLERGQSLALIGQSGSGKSTIAKAVLRLLPDHNADARGAVVFEGSELLAKPEREFRGLRGRRIGFVPQDPQNSFNLVRTIGSQAYEAAELVDGLSRAEQKEAILDVFAKVGLPDPQRVFDSYPHQLSGGQLQRVLIGLTVLPKPSLIVADEPTSALDVTIQKLILDLLTDLQQSLGISLLLITHDLAIAAERSERVVVLRDGLVQESGPSEEVFAAPKSEYAVKLQSDVPALHPDRYRLAYPRAAHPGGGEVRRIEQIEVREARKVFHVSGREELVAVDDVSFSVPSGRTHALVGESGSGKTTLVRLLLGLEKADSGDIRVSGDLTTEASAKEFRRVRRNLQLVYQNPYTSLDSTWKVDRIIREPLDQYRIGTRTERSDRVAELLSSVGLAEELRKRRPTELSGGQRQRVAIARALALRPKVLVLDEPTSALDVSVQSEIIEVLFRLQSELGLTYLFVSHDLSLIRQVADTVSVLRLGKKVEEGPVEQIFSDPKHEYTRSLIDSIPRVSATVRV